MQTTGHLVGAFFELAAGMEDRHDDVDGGDAGAVHRHRDAAAVVGDLDATVFEDADVDLGGEAAIASSTALSTTSHTRWCRPRSPVDPMYMPGRLRTASRPSRTLIDSAP